MGRGETTNLADQGNERTPYFTFLAKYILTRIIPRLVRLCLNVNHNVFTLHFTKNYEVAIPMLSRQFINSSSRMTHSGFASRNAIPAPKVLSRSSRNSCGGEGCSSRSPERASSFALLPSFQWHAPILGGAQSNHSSSDRISRPALLMRI
jgi:hypothetical protein